VAEPEETPHPIEARRGLERQRRARVDDDAILTRGARKLDGDDVEALAALVAERGRAAVLRSGEALQRPDALELAHRVHGRLLELIGNAALERALDGAAVGGRRPLERQETFEQLAKVDIPSLHRASLPPCGVAHVRVQGTLR